MEQEVSYWGWGKGVRALRPLNYQHSYQRLAAMPGMLRLVVVEVGQGVSYWWIGEKGGGLNWLNYQHSCQRQ